MYGLVVFVNGDISTRTRCVVASALAALAAVAAVPAAGALAARSRAARRCAPVPDASSGAISSIATSAAEPPTCMRESLSTHALFFPPFATLARMRAPGGISHSCRYRCYRCRVCRLLALPARTGEQDVDDALLLGRLQHRKHRQTQHLFGGHARHRQGLARRGGQIAIRRELADERVEVAPHGDMARAELVEQRVAAERKLRRHTHR